jgi:Spx/MgsR family transcriptional regulator
LARAVTVYGIPNCDTVKRARAWLDERGVDYRFHDFKRDGLDAALAGRFVAALGPDTLINRRGTTWRKLDAAVQAQAGDAAGAARLAVTQPSVVKRPVLDVGGALSAGFDATAWNRLFA